MRRFVKASLIAFVALLPIAFSDTQLRATICGYFLEFLEFGVTPGGIGISYDDTTDSMIVSLNHPTGTPATFNRIDLTTATHTPYSAATFPGLVKLTTITSSACTAGFVPGDVYAGSDLPGEIVKIGNGGATVTKPWVILPGEAGFVRGVHQDRHCVMNGDLIVVTGTEAPAAGNVWRVTAAGEATLIAQIGKPLEGVVVLPNNTALYGPMAGRIVVGDKDRQGTAQGPNGKLFAIDGTGDIFTIGGAADFPQYPNYQVENPLTQTVALFNPHDIDVVPVPRDGVAGDGDLFAITGTGELLRGPSAAVGLSFCKCGGLLLTQEFSRETELGPESMYVLSWDGLTFNVEVQGVSVFANVPTEPTSWRDVAFRGGADCRTCSGVIGDYVWKDLDEDGMQDGNEPGVAGVKVTLTQPNVPGYSLSTYTDETGKYQFGGLCLGTYVVTVTLPDGDTFTQTEVGNDPTVDSNANGTTVTLDTDTDSDLTIDFGVKGPGVIGNFVWHDLDKDGVQDGGEPGIGGVTVHLKLGHNAVGPDIATTVTDAAGSYIFQNLNPGDYTVLIDPPADMIGSPVNVGAPDTDSNPNPSNVTLTVAQPVDETIDFGFYTPPKFGHIIVNKVTLPATNMTTVFTFETTGPGYTGFTLTGGASSDSGALVEGTYSVAEVNLPAGWSLTNSFCDGGNTPSQIVLLADQVVTCTFTNTQKAALGDFVWKDANANGIQDSGEVGISGVTVQLLDSASAVIATTSTNASGYYLFPNLDPATYAVKFVAPTGSTFSPQNVGADNLDSDANPPTGVTAPVTLAPGEVNLTVDAGIVPPPPPPVCIPTVFTFTGNTSTSGTVGNVRTFTVGSISVKASAFSRDEASGSWSSAYLGLYGAGLGVTDGSEGSGGYNKHKVDNIGGRDNYVLFEFNTPVLVNKALLDAIGADSDVSIWVGTKTDPYNNHLTLSDALLGTLATEENSTSLTVASRWADINPNGLQGNVLVIAALASDTSPEDEFKISKLDIACEQPPPPPACVPGTFTFSGSSPTSGAAGNVRTFSLGSVSVRASAFSRKNYDGTWNTAYLGLYGPGLGVTDGSEGTGSGSSHKVDNVGTRNNYVLFEFSSPVIVDKAFLTYIGYDSDVSAWVGTRNDPYNNHLTLSDSLLSTLLAESNTSSTGDDTRWADLNNGSVMGNVLVIAAKTGDSDDEFKINKLTIACVPPPPSTGCIDKTIQFTGSSSTSGTAGNIRTFTYTGLSVKASAFSRTDAGAWNSAFLGAWSAGLGVTDGSEGSGGNNSHTVDNYGRDNYVLFEFNAPVKVDQLFLDYILEDADVSVWVGSRNDPYNNHLSLTDALLASLAGETNTSSLTGSRWANVNAGGVVGNVLVVAAKVGETNDSFKISKLDICK